MNVLQATAIGTLHASVLAALCLLAFVGKDKGRFVTVPTTCSMQVWINQSIDRVSGRRWPHYDDGRPLEVTMTDEPCETVLHLPSGRVLDLQSKSTTMNQDHGIVTMVSVLPLPRLVTYEAAIAEAKRFAENIGIHDNRFYEKLSTWKKPSQDRGAVKQKYMAVTNLEHGVDLSLEIKEHWREPGWFIAASFEGETPSQ